MITRDSAAPPPLRIMIVDDHPAVREGLALLLSPEGMQVCAEAGNRLEALARLEECRPDVAIVDLSLENEDGLTLAADLKALGVPALVYSMHGDPQHVEDAFAAGVLGYVTKREFRGILIEAIRQVAAGRRFVSPRAAVALAERPREASTSSKLSGKELEVYQLLERAKGPLKSRPR